MTHQNQNQNRFAGVHRILFTSLIGIAGLSTVGCSPQDVLLHSIRSVGSSNTNENANEIYTDGYVDSSQTADNRSGRRGNDSGYVKVVDPREQAFSVAVPRGWKTDLGMVRPSGQPRSFVESISPDGATRVFVGDVQMPMFVEPGSMTTLASGNNPMIQVSAYTPSQNVGQDYVRRAFAQAPGFEITGVEPNPSLSRLLQERAAKQGLQPQIESSTITFQFQNDGRPAHGKLNASTFRMQGFWGVDVNGFTTTSDPSAADQALSTIIASFESSPQWQQREKQRNQLAMQQSQASHQQRMANNQAQFNAHQARMAANSAAADQRFNSWMGQQRSNDRMHEMTIDAIRDETAITNGQYRTKVDSGYDNYYVNPTTNEWFGTNGPDTPIVDGYEIWNEEGNR